MRDGVQTFRSASPHLSPGGGEGEGPKRDIYFPPGEEFETFEAKQWVLSVFYTIPMQPNIVFPHGLRKWPLPKDTQLVFPLAMWLEEVQDWARGGLSTEGGLEHYYPRGMKIGAGGTGGTPQVFIRWVPFSEAELSEAQLVALSGTGHLVPVDGWTTGARFDRLVVGDGNYEPQPGDLLYELMNEQRHAIEVWDQFEKENPGTAKAIIEAEIGAALIMEDELQGNFGRMRESRKDLASKMKERDKAIAKEEGELAAAWSVLIFEATHDYMAKYQEPLFLWDQHNDAYDINGHGAPLEWAPYMRRRFGPMLNGVKKWAYRINLSKPWPEGPDLTKPESGCIIIELRSPAGTREPGAYHYDSSFVPGETLGDYPWDHLESGDNGFELQIPATHIPHPSSLAVGPIETGIVRPDPLEIAAYG